MTKEACRPPKCSSRVRIHKPKTHHSTPTPSLSREGNRDPERERKLPEVTQRVGKKVQTSTRERSEGQPGREGVPPPSASSNPRPEPGVQPSAPAPYLPPTPEREPPLPCGALAALPRSPASRAVQVSPCGCQRGTECRPLPRARARARAALGLRGAPANGAEPAPRPAPPRPRRPRAPAPCLPLAHPFQPRSFCCSFCALAVLLPGLLQRTLTPKQLIYCAECSAVML